MARLEWDKDTERFYETGVSHGVLFKKDSTGTNGYAAGVAWNGLTAVNESPSGAEANDIYADNIKYLSLISPETYGFTIEAYMSPEEFDECDGIAKLGDKIKLGQQSRTRFGFCWRTEIGNDVTDKAGYQIHIVYDSVAAPSSKDYATMNESPEAMTLSWECSCNPIKIPDGVFDKEYSLYSIVIDTTKLDEDADIEALEAALYGVDEAAGVEAADPYLPTPEQIADLLYPDDDSTV